MLMSSFNFGEYDGRQEYLRGEKYFLDSFMTPPNFNINNISNRKKFIIIGHKGVGKSSVQLFLEKSKQKEGYLTDFLSFYDDLSPNDYLEFSKTQKISFVEIANAKDITALYDFREVWVRIVLKKIADLLSSEFPSKFTTLMRSTHSGSRSLVDGIVNGLKIKADFQAVFSSIGFEYDFSRSGNSSQMPLSDFNDVCLGLLKELHGGAMVYFSIDELVVSNFETKSDEFKVRMAIIRDAVKASNKLNNYFVKNNIDINIICSLRPEVRDILYTLDSDISKFLDGCYMNIEWNDVETLNHPLIAVLYRKIQSGSPVPLTDQEVRDMFKGTISLSREKVPIPLFLLRQSWHRPRDVVRFLKCYADKNSSETAFNEDGVKKMLDDYSRISARECFDEITVKYSHDFTGKIRDLIRKNYYDSYEDFISTFAVLENRIDTAELCDDLYKSGVIFNVDRADKNNRYFSAHRGIDKLYKDMAIRVHQGLWHYFSIRHRE